VSRNAAYSDDVQRATRASGLLVLQAHHGSDGAPRLGRRAIESSRVYAMARESGPAAQPLLPNKLSAYTPCECRLLSIAVAELKTGCRTPIAHAAGMLGSTYLR